MPRPTDPAIPATQTEYPPAWVLDLLLGIAVALVIALVISAEYGGQQGPDLLAYLFACGFGVLMLARLDIRMPGLDGLAATRQIVGDAKLNGTRVIVLTTFDEDEQIYEAIRSGAAGYLLKDSTPDELRRAVHMVAEGEALLSPSITKRVMQQLATGAGVTNPSLVADLTEREQEILRHIGLGESNEEIAANLVISPATARTYVSRLLSKLDARDRSQLVIIAYESGLVKPGQA